MRLQLAGLVLAVLPVGFISAEEPDGGKHIVLMIGEQEYGTATSLRDFFEQELDGQGYRATFIVAENKGPGRNEFNGLPAAMKSADLLVLSTRRRAPRLGELQAVRDHVDAGKPLIGIRTASHPFDTRGNVPDGHADWVGFDEAVLGAKYTGHYGDELFRVEVAPGASSHLLLSSVSIGESSKLYKIRLTSDSAKLLLTGCRENGEVEPVAWTHLYGPEKAPVFYTSLGLVTDFESRDFRQLLLNAVRWSTGSPAATGQAVRRK